MRTHCFCSAFEIFNVWNFLCNLPSSDIQAWLVNQYLLNYKEEYKQMSVHGLFICVKAENWNWNCEVWGRRIWFQPSECQRAIFFSQDRKTTSVVPILKLWGLCLIKGQFKRQTNEDHQHHQHPIRAREVIKQHSFYRAEACSGWALGHSDSAHKYYLWNRHKRHSCKTSSTTVITDSIAALPFRRESIKQRSRAIFPYKLFSGAVLAWFKL